MRQLNNYLMMMTVRVRLKKRRKPTKPRLRFDPEELKPPPVTYTLQATKGGKLAQLIILKDDDIATDTMITTHNTPVTYAVSEILGKEHCRKKPRTTKYVLDLCYLKKWGYGAERKM